MLYFPELNNIVQLIKQMLQKQYDAGVKDDILYVTWTDLQQTTRGKSVIFNSESNGFGELQASLEIGDHIKINYISDAIYIPVTNYSLYDCCEG